MRLNQITLKIERFGGEAPNKEYQKIEVFGDGKDISSALQNIYKIAIETINNTSKNERLNIKDILDT